MKLKDHSSYVWLLAHPDDEVYTINIIQQAIEAGQQVDLVYATSGDYAGDHIASTREAEVLEVARLIGLDESRVHFLRIGERVLFDRASELLGEIVSLVKGIKPDCIVGHDFEGGHNGHDLVSYCAARVAADIGAGHWVFPAYHKQPDERIYNSFKEESGDGYILELDPGAQNLKRSAIAAHQTQADFFERVLSSSSVKDYMSREVLRRITEEIDYTKKPTNPVGYEFTGSSLRFSDFIAVLEGLG